MSSGSIPRQRHQPSSEVPVETREGDSKPLPPTEGRIRFMKKITERGLMIPAIFDPENVHVDDRSLRRLRKPIIDIIEFVRQMNMSLKYIKSGTTGHTFRGTCRDDPNLVVAIKIAKYPKDEYGPMANIRRPENVELRIIQMLAPFVTQQKTPHLVMPFYTFNTSIDAFINIPRSTVDLSDKKNHLYQQFIEEYENGDLEDYVSVLITEWCYGGDFLDYVRNNHKTMTRSIWRNVLFQLLFTFAKIHEKYPSFRHNDAKPNNILVQITETSGDPDDTFIYEYGKHYFVVPNIGIRIALWDFDFSSIEGEVENNKVNADWTDRIGVSNRPNQYYDIHYFFNFLFAGRFIKDITKKVPRAIIEFVRRVVPPGYRHVRDGKVSDKYRLIVHDEVTTPGKLITHDPLFDPYRHRLTDLE